MGSCIEHVSRTQGDGPGYDIVLFETDGRERMIEVKTTAFDAMTPFPNLNQRTCVYCKFLHILDEGVVGGAA